MTEAERMGAVVGQIMGAVVLTYLLTRAVKYLAKKGTSHIVAALIAFFVVGAISLTITSFTMGIGRGFIIYIPCLVLWLIIDIVRAQKAP